MSDSDSEIYIDDTDCSELKYTACIRSYELTFDILVVEPCEEPRVTYSLKDNNAAIALSHN